MKRFTVMDGDNIINFIIASDDYINTYCNYYGYTYFESPLPAVEPADSALDPDADRDAMLVDLEYRITLLELGVTE